MAGNNRVFFPIESFNLGKYCSASGIAVKGLQSVSTTTNFNLEQVFELGQLDIYANMENLPTIEISATKVFDGYPGLYILATTESTSAGLLQRSNTRCDAIFSIFSDQQISASGIPLVQAYTSGLYVNTINFNLPVNGNLTETLTLTGNDKVWITSSGTTYQGHTGYYLNGYFDDKDSPAASGGIRRRQNVVMGNAAAGGSVWPRILPGITTVTGSGYNIQTAGVFGAHIQDVTVSCNLGRTDLYELGRRRPYYRYANFPVAVDCTINITAGGTNPSDNVNANADIDNLTDEPIVIAIDEGTVIDLGTKNKCLSINFTGGDTGGGVRTISYQFQNFNHLTVTSPSDPAALTP